MGHDKKFTDNPQLDAGVADKAFKIAGAVGSFSHEAPPLRSSARAPALRSAADTVSGSLSAI